MPDTLTLKLNKDTTLVRRIADAALLVMAGLYVFLVDISKTMIKPGVPGGWEKHIIIAIFAAVLFRSAAVLIEEKADRKTWLIYMAMAVLVDLDYFMVYRETHPKAIVVIALLTLGMVGMEYRKMLLAYIAAASVVLFPAIAMAWTGAIENLVYIRDMTLRSSWGIQYPTDMMSLLFFLLIAVWVVLRSKSSLWFLIPGSILLVMSYYIADSRTGVMCDMVFMIAVCIEYLFSRREVKPFRKFVGFCACAAFPVFAIIMNGLVFAYRRGIPIAVRLNGMMSNRLALTVDALNKYGLSLFGRPLKQTGMGGTTLYKPGYDFVDISYCLILLKYGIITLIVITILWVLMTRKAIKLGDWRLALALAVIAFNSISEHHITQINYDIFLILPFAILSSGNTKDMGTGDRAEHEEANGGTIRNAVFRALTLLVLAAVYVLAGLALLPKARTVISLIGLDGTEDGRRILWILYAAGIALAAAAFLAMYRICKGFINKEKGLNKRAASIVGAFLAAVCIVVIGANLIISRGAGKKAEVISSEKDAIELVKASKTGKLYSYDMTEVYSREYGGISSRLFDGEELARFNNTSVIMDINTDSPCFFNTGFLYTPISDDHALLTNDRAVITSLQDAGYHMTGYCPVRTDVDMQNEAELNEVDLQEDGSIVLSGEKEALRKGPRADLGAGRYTMTYDLSIDKNELKGTVTDKEICTLRISYYKGKYTAAELPVTYGMFDKDGNYKAEILCTVPDAERTNMQVFTAGNSKVTVRGMSYQRTPERDVHYFYDENRVKYREEYYDLEGNPDRGSWGYTAKEIGYDDQGNVDHETYYDEEGNKTLNSSGYAEVKKEFNDIGQNIHEEYYGTDGKRIALKTGQSATSFAYDAFGRQTEVSYYDVQDAPVLAGGDTWGGYHKVIREYDENNWIAREDFYGVDGDLALIKEGYASREYVHDDHGNRIREIYYDQAGARTLNIWGYNEVRREFNSNDQNIRETYYGVDGAAVIISSGQAITENKYDEKGLLTETAFYDAHNNPVLAGGKTWGGYHKVVRKYDNYGRIIGESFCGIDGRPVMIKEGYSYRETVYDELGNVSEEHYYDTDGNEVNP